MGQRSGAETVAAVVLAFLKQRTWKQADLAGHVGVAVPALRKRLLELSERGMPLSSEFDHPHVYWSVPKGWLPDAVAIDKEELPHLVRLVARSPRSAQRDRLLRRLVRFERDAENLGSTLVTRTPSKEEESFLPLAEDAATRHVALRLHYFTASRGALEWRHVSVQRVHAGSPTRLAAVCHRSGRLKWFRVDNILAAHLDPEVPFKTAAPEAVEKFQAGTVDGFHDGGAATACEFVVRAPEAHWVQRNLLDGMRFTAEGDQIRVVAPSSALPRVARWVVGLGDAAKCETPELAALVAALARGALSRSERT